MMSLIAEINCKISNERDGIAQIKASKINNQIMIESVRYSIQSHSLKDIDIVCLQRNRRRSFCRRQEKLPLT